MPLCSRWLRAQPHEQISDADDFEPGTGARLGPLVAADNRRQRPKKREAGVEGDHPESLSMGSSI
jgi:hypothetical protein